MTEVIKLPQPNELSEREKDDAMGAYLMMFAAWAVGLPLPVLNLIAAVIYFYVNKKSSRFVAFHALQSLFSQVPVTMVNIGLVAWLVRTLIGSNGFSSAFFIYLSFMVLINLLYLIFSIIGLVHARKGRFYYMPLFGRISFSRYYGPNAESLSKPVPPNRPPEGF